MKKITVSVDENVLAAVRRLAAEHNSTLNALVRDYLTNLAAHDDRESRSDAIAAVEQAISGSAWQENMGAGKSCMTARVFFDTNVLVHGGGNGQRRTQAKTRPRADGMEDFGTSAQVLQEFFVRS